MAGAMARGDDDKDEEIARLRGALRRATAAAMAYAETATAELGAMKSRLEQVERKSEEDARTIDELRARVERATTSTSTSNTDATAGIRAAFEAETRRLGERARVAERERDDALRSCERAVALRAREESVETPVGGEDASRITEEALLRRRCDDADGLLRQYAAEGAALAEEANEAARRNRALEAFASDAFALVEDALGDIAADAQGQHCGQAHAPQNCRGDDTQCRAAGAADAAGLLGEPVADECSDYLADHIVSPLPDQRPRARAVPRCASSLHPADLEPAPSSRRVPRPARRA